MSSLDVPCRPRSRSALGDAPHAARPCDRGELTIEVPAADYSSRRPACCATRGARLRAADRPVRRRLLGLPRRPWDGPRFCVVYAPAVARAQLARAPAGVLPGRRRARRSIPLTGVWTVGQLVRARGLRPVRHRLRRPPRPAPHPHRLRLHRPSVPQGLPGHGPRRDALRPRAEARDLPAGHRSSRARSCRASSAKTTTAKRAKE